MTSAACLTAMASLRADAGYVTLAVPAAALATAEAIALEPVKVGWRRATPSRRSPRPPGARALSRSGRASAAGRAGGQLVRAPARAAGRCRRSSTPTRCSAWSRCHARRRRYSRRTRASSRGCSIATRTGSASIGSRQRGPPPAASARPCSSRAPDTLVASPDGDVVVCDLGPPALATAGTGDVLTGVVAAFLSKRLDAATAGAAAAIAHGCAARLAEHTTGLVAGDLLGLLPAALEA